MKMIIKGSYTEDSFYTIGDGETYIMWDDEELSPQYTYRVLASTKYSTYTEACEAWDKLKSILRGTEYKPILIKIRVEYSE
jgi:hypothetical protein